MSETEYIEKIEALLAEVQNEKNELESQLSVYIDSCAFHSELNEKLLRLNEKLLRTIENFLNKGEK